MPSRPTGSKTHPIRRILLIAAEVAVLVYLAVDGGLNVIVRPLWRLLGRWRLFTRLGAAIADLPAYAVLAVLAVPFAIAEPAKVYAVYLMTSGHFHMGTVIMVVAYAVSLVVVDRIYHAGKEKLRTISWVATLLDWLFAVRDTLLAWARKTPAWQAAVAMKARVGAFARGWRRRLPGSRRLRRGREA